MNIKNLKINMNKRKKINRPKLVKIRVAITALSLSVALLLSGCHPGKAQKKATDYEKTSTSYTNSYESSTTSFDNPYLNIDDFDYNFNISVPNESYNSFVKYIDSIDTVYEYENYYHIDEALKEYDKAKNKKVNNHSYKLENITADTIYNSVKENNKIYISEKEKNFVSKFYSEFSDSELKKICTIISDALNYYIEEGKVNDIDELKCILADLKILEKSTMANAYVTDDNCMVISPKMIEAFKLKAKKKGQDIYKDVIAHETAHLVQKSCKDTMEIKNSVGSSVRFENLNVNPLYWDWFFEASAEKMSMKYTGDPATTYEYFINYFESLSLSTILYKDNYADQILDSSLKKSFDPLFNAFKANTEEQKREIIKMMFTLDIIEEKNKEFYAEFNSNMTDDEYVDMDRKLKNSVCETLAKSFYKSLAENVKDNNLKLNDIFYLITLFESDIDSHISYSKEERYTYVKPFVEKYVEIQNEFFYYLSTSKKYTLEEIQEKFNSYGVKKSNNDMNYNINYLNKDKKSVLEYFNNKFSTKRTEQIRDSLVKIKKCNQKGYISNLR